MYGNRGGGFLVCQEGRNLSRYHTLDGVLWRGCNDYRKWLQPYNADNDSGTGTYFVCVVVSLL